MTFSPGAEECLHEARRQAVAMGSATVQPAHVLLGCLTAGTSATDPFYTKGLTTEEVGVMQTKARCFLLAASIYALRAALQLCPCVELASTLREAGITHEEARMVLADGLKESPSREQSAPPSAVVAHIFGGVLPLSTRQLVRAAAVLAAGAGMCTTCC
jgi:hypothetical protein